MNSTLAERFRYLRQMKENATQDELAMLMGVKRSRIADIERGKVRELKTEEVRQLQEKLSINGWWLMTGEGDVETPENVPQIASRSETLVLPADNTALEQVPAAPLQRYPDDESVEYYHVEYVRAEPEIPRNVKLLLKRTSDFRDGDALLIKDKRGFYIKQYQIDMGEKEGKVLLKGESNRYLSLMEIEVMNAAVIGVVLGYLKEF